MPGVSVNVDPTTQYSSYEGADVLKFAFYTAGGKKLTGQTDLVDNAKATQIIDLDQLDNATYFVFPFSKVPMLRSTYVMTNADMKSDGIDDTANHPTSRIKAVFTRGSLNVASINMPFGVTNVANQPSITSKDGGAQSVGKEVRDALRETADLGAIFRSINVNDMIKKGFVFLSNLRGIGGDNFIDLMILPTQDPATFRIIAFVGKSQRGGDDDGDGVSYNFNANDLAEDYGKFMEEMNKSPKSKDDDDDGDGELEFNFYGTIVLDARIGVTDGKWNITFRGGNVGTNVKGKYEWGQTFFCGPVPAFISFEVGFHADLEVSFGNKDSARAMLLDASLGVSMEAFAGLGFDLSLVALQLGIYGQIGADVDFLLLTPSNAAPSTGTKLTISGEIGIKLKVKILFISYSKTFASTGFNWTKKWNRYDQIRDYWNDQGYGELFGVTRKGRAYQMLLFADGSAAVAIEGGAELESRDYLELQERAWNNGVNSGKRLLKSANSLTNVLTNAYPHSHPAFTDDGEMFVYVSDNDNAKAVESVASYAVSNGSGFDDKGRIDTSTDNVLADLDVVASGTKENAFAAWVKQVEMPQMDRNPSITNDDLGMMFNATEVYASAYDGSNWTSTRLTDNFVADMSPAIASYGNKAIVAWRSMYASSMSSSEDITAVFDMENNINYRIYNGTEWTEAKVAYNGSVGSVNAIDCAMLKDGTALLTYTVRTGKDVTSTETFYTVIKADGTTLTTGRLTNDNFTDTNAQVTAVNDGNGYFVIGWYSEHDAGEGSTSDYDEDGNASNKEAVAHDIRLARIHANGSYDADFPESIGGTTSSGISADYHFSAPADNADLTKVAIVWSQRKVSDAADDAGKYQLQAVRFYKQDDSIGFTAPTLIAETSKNYTIDRFDAITDASGALHAIILGSDYDNIQGIEVYDSIDLDAAARKNVSDNSDAPSNLDILDGEAISSIKLAIATFPEISADVVANINILDVVPGLTSTVQFVLTNTGSATLSKITATIASTSQTFAVNLLPNRSMTLLMDYEVPSGAVNDVNYSLEAEGIELGSGTLTLNRPDIGISGVSIKREESGQRDIQVFLSNGTDIPLAGSGKTVKLAFYKDAFYEKMIGEAITIPEEDYASIDRGNYFLMHTISVSDLYAGGGEIPDGGINVYVRAYVEGCEEPITSNNEGFVRVESLVERNEGAKLGVDTSLEENEGAYTVTAEIRNHSMLDVNIGIPVAILRDAEGNIIARKNIQDSELEIGKESVVEGLSVTFLANEIDGTPVQAEVKNIVPVHFDVNGGTGEYADVYTDLDGHIDLPDNDPLVPNNNPLLFFRGWYDSPRGGNLVTNDSVIYVKTTLYARYSEHEHVFEYSLEDDGKTIKAVCVSTADDICPLEEVGRTASLTIHAPERAGDGYGMPEATITGATNVLGTPEIVYYIQNEDGSRGKALTKAPVDAGKYWAEFTIEIGKDSVTAHVAYEIPYIEGVAANDAQIPNFVKASDASAFNELGQCSALEAYAWISANADKLNLASYDKRSIVVFNKQYMTRPEGMPEDIPWEYDENKEYAVCFEYQGRWIVTYYLPDDMARFLTDGYSEVYVKGTDSTSVFGEVNFEKITTREELSAVSCTEKDALLWIVANLGRYPRAIVVFSEDNGYYNFLTYDNDRGMVNTDQGDPDWLFQVAEMERKQVFLARPSDVLNPYKTYTITYNANGGNGEIAPGTFYVKSDIVIADGSELSKPNLVFDSWNTAPDGSGDSYKPGDRLELLGNITLYAQFKHDHHWNITYDKTTRTFTASCDSDGCDITIHPTLELKAEGKTYDGKAVVSYVCSATWTEENGLPMPSIVYYVGGKRAVEAKNAGTYTTLVTLGSDTITLDEFTIAPRPIVVKADDKEMHEGEDEPELTVSFEPTSAAESGLVDGDILDFTITRQEGDVEGTYAITVKMGDNPNYDVQNVDGTFTILAPLGPVQTIEVNDVTARYGDTGVKIDAKITEGDGALSYIVKSGDAVTVDDSGNLTILKAGTAVIAVVASQTATYAKTTKNINVTIQLGTIEVSANDEMALVDGKAHGIHVIVNKPVSGYVIHYGLAEGTYDLTASPTLTEEGTLTVYYRVSADNYETVTGSVKLTLSTHTHDYAYSVGSKANTIIAVCSADGCPLPEHTAILVIDAPSGILVYSGQAYVATLADENGIAGSAKILYALKGTDGNYEEVTEAAPIGVGAYRASITVGNVTAYVEFEIKPAKITEASVVPAAALVYNGTAQTPTVNVNATTVNGQPVTFTYSLSENGTYGAMPNFTNVSEAGTVYFKVSAPNHEDAYGSFVVAMEKGNQPAPLAPTLDHASSNTIKLVAVQGYEYSRDGSSWQDSPVFTGLDKMTEYTFYQRAKETENQFASPSSVSAKFSTTNHAHEWGNFVVNGATITATCLDSDGGHGSDKTATMVITAPTLTVYGGSGSAEATMSNGIDGILTPSIVYKQGDKVLPSAPTNAGTYTANITLKGTEIGVDHDVTASVTYTIAKKALTVTANPASIVYGEAPKGNGVVYDGFLPGEDEKVLTGAVGYAFDYVQYGNVGTYAITPQGLSSSNYEITFVKGALTVTPKEITVNIDKKTAHYGDDQVTLTGTSDGIVNNDQNVYTLACDVTKTTGVGAYNIVGAVTSENYVVTFVGGENAYEVTKRPITLTAEEKTIKMGEALPTYSFNSSEALPAEVLATLQEKTSLSCQGNASAAGKYKIAFAFDSGVTGENVLANYVVTLQEGYLYVLSSVLTDPSSGNTGVEILLDNATDAFDYNVSVAIGVETPTEGSTPTSFDLSKYIDRRSEISKVYSITLYRTETVDGVETKREIQPSDMKQGLSLIIKIEIPQHLAGRNFRILHIHSESDIEYVDAANLEIKEGFAYVRVNRLSQFAFVSLKASEEINHAGWCLGWLVVIFDALLAAYLVVYVILHNKKRLDLIGLGLSGALTVFATIVLILHVCYVSIIGLALAVAMLLGFIIIFIRRNKSGDGGATPKAGQIEPVAEVVQEEVTEPESEIPLALSEAASADDETIQEEDEEAEIVGGVIYRKSFLARLCQSSDSVKGYYSDLKNEALAYGDTNSRLSWDGDSIVSGRTTIAKFAIRRKVLCVYFPLNAEDYVGSKIEVEKPAAAKYAKLPCMCRVDSARKFGQAKRLVAASAKKRGLRKGEVPTRDYKLPYESTEELESKGLAKKINRHK
ncbi:MAG: InlB B-repeat-containing protein [Bacilli bacterium]|nr:InlB B-repeat-containing protein [Bacilli bacterium]